MTPTLAAAHRLADSASTLLRVEQIYSYEDAEFVPATVEPTAPASILYTSGTTSRPKGVVVTHANYVYAGTAVADHLDVGADDRWLVVLPLFHANAQYYCAMSALVRGASLAVTSRFSASNWGRQAHELGATLASLFAAPVRMVLAAERTSHDNRNALRATLFAQNLSTDDVTTFESRFDCPLLQLYGMTETIAPVTFNPTSARRADTIGPTLRGRRVRIVDDAGHDVEPGRSGELLVGGIPGRTLMAGYLNNAAATTATIDDDGWLHTGDLVRADSAGYLSFVDRSKDMIKRAGENVASAEVERVVDAHPAVAESAAIGVPDPVRDESIVVFAVLHPDHPVTGDELRDWCAGRLARFKVPDAVRIRDRLPRTSVGKVRKTELRREHLETLTTTSTLSPSPTTRGEAS